MCGGGGGLSRRRFGQLVGRDHDTSCRRLGIDKSESSERAAIGKEAMSCSQNQWMDQEYVRVNQVVLYQRLDQLSAAEDHDILA